MPDEVIVIDDSPALTEDEIAIRKMIEEEDRLLALQLLEQESQSQAMVRGGRGVVFYYNCCCFLSGNACLVWSRFLDPSIQLYLKASSVGSL